MEGGLKGLVGLGNGGLGLCGQGRGLCLLDVGYLLLGGYYNLHLLGLSLIYSQLLHQLLGLDGCLLELGLHLGEGLLHFLDCVVGVKQFVEAILESRYGEG